MKALAVLGVSAALACGGGAPRAAPPPAPRPGAPPAAPGTVAPETRIQYRIQGPLRYEISRYDSLLFLGTGSGAPQVTGRRAHVSVRAEGTRLQVSLDSVAGVLGPRLAPSTIDSALSVRWEGRLSPSGLSGQLRASRNSVLVGQVGAAIRLLFPQLPDDGVATTDTWEDSAEYPVRIDAFETVESSARSSGAARGAAPGSIRIQVTERLTRSGKVTQGGRTMALAGSGGRQVVYDLAREGWVTMLRARDSLDLTVTVPDSPTPIPVRLRSTVIARLRGTPPA